MTRGLGVQPPGWRAAHLLHQQNGDGECGKYCCRVLSSGVGVAVGACGQRAKGSASSGWFETNRTVDTQMETSKVSLDLQAQECPPHNGHNTHSPLGPAHLFSLLCTPQPQLPLCVWNMPSCSYPRPFALAVLTSWCTLPTGLPIAGSLLLSTCCWKGHLLRRNIPDNPIKNNPAHHPAFFSSKH